MSQWKITKTFEACYGHRVWNQKLIQGYSEDQCLVCRHLHGHQASIQVSLKGNELKDGMVTDFKNLGWFKKFVDNVIDHKFIMDINDPLLKYEIPHIFQDGKLYDNNLKYHEDWGYDEGFYTIHSDLFKYLDQPLKEKYEGMVLVQFVPTSENLAKWMFDIVNYKMSRIGIETESVVFYETPKSRSEYVG